MRIVVVGASGFVGSHAATEFERQGHEVTRVRAPRLTGESVTADVTRELAGVLGGHDVVVNCAGDPDASSADEVRLHWANAVLPGLVGEAAHLAGVERFVHVSSAVVQGRRPVLDSSDHLDAFSPYARSKADGERSATSTGPRHTTVYRPPSVHAASRRITRQLARIATTPAATVAAPGDRPSPQTHIRDVASALVFLATSPTPPPAVVHHPWQGHTTAGLLRALGDGREPTQVPRLAVTLVIAVAHLAARLVPRLAPHARRVEMIWLGQEQARSWLDDQGWTPETTEADWRSLGRQAREHTIHNEGRS
ncbi:NAD-dependent epimerase/dehydratase family protein [Oryzobacter telluris]|uniref:NAD-dependent epimerase/dehydratase family protein n=1 Tax=Oryzobacter telluris TaxID=3149179 RepID=UPI00370D9E06